MQFSLETYHSTIAIISQISSGECVFITPNSRRSGRVESRRINRLSNFSFLKALYPWVISHTGFYKYCHEMLQDTSDCSSYTSHCGTGNLDSQRPGLQGAPVLDQDHHSYNVLKQKEWKCKHWVGKRVSLSSNSQPLPPYIGLRGDVGSVHRPCHRLGKGCVHVWHVMWVIWDPNGTYWDARWGRLLQTPLPLQS